MTRAKYLIRFDDICSTMNWDVWNQIEPALINLNIKPILAVVPDNKDNSLNVKPSIDDFWEKVRFWQRLGWTIGLHGFQHVYETDHAGIIGINSKSEFAGLPYNIQRNKIQQALEIFNFNGIKTNVWVAPAHSFDILTIHILQEMGINIISDGFFLRPVKFMNMIWIPQQLWRFRFFPIGIWTVCFHINHFTENDIKSFIADIKLYRPHIINIDEIINKNTLSEISFTDKIFFWVWKHLILYKKRHNERKTIS